MIKTITPRQYMFDLEETLPPEPFDLAYAKALDPAIAPCNDGDLVNCYSGNQGVAYYCIEVEYYKPNRIGETRNFKGPIWFRSSFVTTGGYTEPEDVDEVIVDCDPQIGYTTLADAVKESKRNELDREMYELNPSCIECLGSGIDNYVGKHPCEACDGLGFHKGGE